MVVSDRQGEGANGTRECRVAYKYHTRLHNTIKPACCNIVEYASLRTMPFKAVCIHSLTFSIHFFLNSDMYFVSSRVVALSAV